MSESQKSKRLFVAMPMTAYFEPIFEAVKSAAIEAGERLRLRIECIHPGSFSGGVELKNRIVKTLADVDAILFDLTGNNPNVMMEVGYAVAIKKPFFIITSDSRVPSNIAGYAHLLYSPENLETLGHSRLVDSLVLFFSRNDKNKTNAGGSNEVLSKVFFSYSHRDRAYLDRLLVHLEPIVRAGLVDLWEDNKIQVGERWKEEIKSALAAARTAILLISADYLASAFIIENELPPLLRAAEVEGTRIIPVLLKPSRFLRDKNLSEFQALNTPEKLVIRMDEAEREELYAKLAEIIEIDIMIPRRF